jgi:hypothetical protein
MMIRPKSIFLYDTANSPKIRISAKVWKVQIKLSCGFCLKENIENVKSAKWAFVQVLN